MKIEASTLIHTYVVSKYMYMIALASKEQAGLKPNRPGGTLSNQVGISLCGGYNLRPEWNRVIVSAKRF